MSRADANGSTRASEIDAIDIQDELNRIRTEVSGIEMMAIGIGDRASVPEMVRPVIEASYRIVDDLEALRDRVAAQVEKKQQPDAPAPPPKPMPGRGDHENAVSDLQGDMALLELATEDLLSARRDLAWEMVRMEPLKGYRLLLLTNDQIRCLTHANGLVGDAVRNLAMLFFQDEELANAA